MNIAPLLKKLWPWAAAVASGVMLGLCYPNWDIGRLIWIWQMPLIAALWFSDPKKEKKRRWLYGLGLGYVAGFTFFAINLSWFFELGRTVGSVWAGLGAWFIIPFYLAIYFGLWGAFAATVGRWVPTEPDESAKAGPGDLFGPSMAVILKAALLAAAWCGLEWLRGIFLTGFGWNGLGVALHENIYLIQFADVVGVTGLSFFIVFASAVWVATLVRMGREIQERHRVRPHLDFAVAVAAVILLFLYGMAQVASYSPVADEDEEGGGENDFVEVRTLLVQLNLPIDRKWTAESLRETMDRYAFFTRSLGVEFSDYDLVVWPETSLPGRFTYDWVQRFLNEEILNAADFHLLAGMEEEEFDGVTIYNSAILMRGSTRDFQSHPKVHLVPFGEFVPWRPIMNPIFGKIVPRDFNRGSRTEPLQMSDPEVGIIPLICFEDTIGRLARKFLRPGPQIMVNVTNDGWFWRSQESAQHLANAKFRCVELRRPMARAANTGVSAFISVLGSLEDPHADAGSAGLTGHQRLRRVQDSVTGDTFVEGTQSARILLAKNPPTTVYARFGEAFSVTAGLIALAAAGFGFWRGRKKRAD